MRAREGSGVRSEPPLPPAGGEGGLGGGGSSRPTGIDRFVADLDRYPESRFTVSQVLAFLRTHPVDVDSLRPYLCWDGRHYTRNLIHKTALYELLALCWEPGQSAAVHNHAGQLCWMAVPRGRLSVQNYRVREIDEATRHCELEPSERYEMNPTSPLAVDPGEPIHDVVNRPEYGERAISLHIYSKPFDRCLVYDLERGRYDERPLFYTTVAGRPL